MLEESFLAERRVVLQKDLERMGFWRYLADKRSSWRDEREEDMVNMYISELRRIEFD